MTENEVKAVRFIKNIKDHAMATLDYIAKEEPNVSPLVYKGREKKADTILAMVEELNQYRILEKRLSDMFCSSVSLKSVVDELERNLKEPDSPHPMKARILTYKESADWGEYRAIGTPEECLRNKDFLRFLANSMNQKKYETYLRIYNAVERAGGDEE